MMRDGFLDPNPYPKAQLIGSLIPIFRYAKESALMAVWS